MNHARKYTPRRNLTPHQLRMLVITDHDNPSWNDVDQRVANEVTSAFEEYVDDLDARVERELDDHIDRLETRLTNHVEDEIEKVVPSDDDMERIAERICNSSIEDYDREASHNMANNIEDALIPLQDDLQKAKDYQLDLGRKCISMYCRIAELERGRPLDRLWRWFTKR